MILLTNVTPIHLFFLRFYLFTFRERGKEGEREGEKHQCVAAFHTPPTGALAHNPGMCPNWESNQQPFGLQAGTQSTEPHQPGQVALFLITYYPGWCSSVDWAWACEPKGCWFNSQLGHMPGLWARSPVGNTWETTTQWYFFPSFFLPPFPSL